MSSCDTTNNNLEEKQHKKIRKRGCSSTSSSSLVRRYRFKRAILVGKKGGSSTSAPLLKTRTRSVRSSPSMATHDHQHAQHKNGTLPYSASGLPSKDKEFYMQARKLAATLWEINDLLPSRVEEPEVEPMRSRKKDVRLCRSGLMRTHMSPDPSYSPFSESTPRAFVSIILLKLIVRRIKGFEVDSCNRRVSTLSYHPLQLADYNMGGLDAHCSVNLIEVGNQPRNKKNCGKCTVGVKNCLKEARNGLSTSKSLLKVLSQVCLQEQHSSSVPLILAISSELDRVSTQIKQLIQEHTSNQNDIENLMKHLAEEKTAWKRIEREKIRDAIRCIAEELEVEKKLRRQTERWNKKIAKEMANVKASYLKASKELEREKRAKEILEQICDELAKGIGEDRAQVEEMKRESTKVREEVEMEREMLQLADVLREERVQMKLSEAKYQFEEKNAVLEMVKSELENFLRTTEENGDNIDHDFKKLRDLESCLSNTCWGFQNLEKENDLDLGDGVEHEDDSADSDLQSIELNMDNDNKSYKWSYACENVDQDDSKRVSIDKDIGRKSFSDKIQWGSICFNRGTASCKKRDFAINIKEISDQFDGERSIEFHLGTQMHDVKEETESYRPIISLQDCISCVNPAERSGQPLTLEYINGEAEENGLTLEGHNLKQEDRKKILM